MASISKQQLYTLPAAPTAAATEDASGAPTALALRKGADESAMAVELEPPNLPAFQEPAIKDGKALPINCTGHAKPLQIMKVDNGFSVRELDLDSGKYKLLFDIPYETVQGFFSDINGCGINPKDGIIYCTMQTSLVSYIVRLSPGVVEFVAKLKLHQTYNTGGFNPAGVFFIANHTAHYVVIDNIMDFKGSNDKNDPKLTDLSNAPMHKPNGWLGGSDVVTFVQDLTGGGEEEYIASMTGKYLQIAKWGGAAAGFTKSWVVTTQQGGWDDIWGAGWQFNGRVFFAANKGYGVYEIPLNLINVNNPDPNATIDLKKVGLNMRIKDSNDGMNCLYMPDPWITKVYPFDCAANGGPIQTTNSMGGISIKNLQMDSGYLTELYDIPWTKTSPPFKFLNGIGINPRDHVPYGSLMTVEAPGDMYIVRFDFEKIEFVGKLKGKYNAIAGTFDALGNYFFLSHPDFGNGTLYKVPDLHDVKGYQSMDNESLTDFSDLPGIMIDEMNQMADIVAIQYDLTGQGEFTDYIVGINRDQQVIVVKWSDANPGASQVWKFSTNDVLSQYKAKLNFGAAWNFHGRIMFASNDGVGVFEATGFNSTTGYVQLSEIGKSSNVELTDGFNCPNASPFLGNASAVKEPTIDLFKL
mmetsp:Transcript_66239/g.120704  ORF Transcript_66239/g.120704 Transcript_66239/m.120704 type:complete len:639 (-) Transcript_66239:113-2029(-)